MIIIVSGDAGSGTSTLGIQLARSLGLPCLDLDNMTNSLLERLSAVASDGRRRTERSSRDVIRAARYPALLTVLNEEVDADIGAIVIVPFTLELQGGAEWEALVRASGGLPRVVSLGTSGELLVQRRSTRPGHRDANVVDAAEPPMPRVTVDASLTIPQQVAAIKRSLAVGRPLPADSPVLGRRFIAGLFDLDGTLIDSTPAVNRSWLRLARELDAELDVGAIEHGHPAAELIASLFPGHLVEQALARLTAIEEKEVEDVIALPGAENLLARLPQHSRAIVTSGTRLIATHRLRAAGLGVPEVLVTFDDVTNGKPDPEPFLVAAERLGVDPADCLAFEDGPAGLAAATAAGCSTVSIVGTHQEHELDGDLMIDGLYQLSVDVLPDGWFQVVPADRRPDRR